MLFDNDNMNLDYTFLNLAGITNNLNFKSNNLMRKDILAAKEGFLRGNMFKDEYESYKNLTFMNIRPKNDREAKLFNVMQYAFAITDLNLYLDLHPEDRSAMSLLTEYINEEKRAKQEYEQQYGPLVITDVKGEKFNWVDGPWPWENVGGSLYV